MRTTGHYAQTQVPTSRETTASELFVGHHATPYGIVRQLRADLPHHAPQDVVEGLAALERVLRAQVTVVGERPSTETPQREEGSAPGTVMKSS